MRKRPSNLFLRWEGRLDFPCPPGYGHLLSHVVAGLRVVYFRRSAASADDRLDSVVYAFELFVSSSYQKRVEATEEIVANGKVM